MAEEVNHPSLVREKFQSHKDHAKARGIAFNFTFEEWIDWWVKALGPDWFSKRGAGKGKFCMARKGDKGPYEPNNVKCILHSQNISEGHKGKIVSKKTRHRLSVSLKGKAGHVGEKNPSVKISEQTVLKIFYAEGTQKQIAKKFNISPTQVGYIRNKEAWTHLTQSLTR